MLGLIRLWSLLAPSRGVTFSCHACQPPACWGSHQVHRARLGSKKYGSSTSSMWATCLALIGALAGLPCCLARRVLSRARGRVDRCYLERYKGPQRLRSRQAAKERAGGRIPRHRGQMRRRAVMLSIHISRYFQVPVYPGDILRNRGREERLSISFACLLPDPIPPSSKIFDIDPVPRPCLFWKIWAV